MPGRRPWLLATATAGGLGIAVLATAASPPSTAGSAETMPQSMRVADALGVDPPESGAAQESDGREQLEQLAASRAQRDSEQAAASVAQAQAEQSAAAARAEAAARAAAEAAEAAAATEAALQAQSQALGAEAVMPIVGARLTSPFGPRWGPLHAGVDLAAPMMTPEFPAMDGIVLQAGPASGFGQVVYTQHQNGDVTVYGHMGEILVESGQTVQAGETIALVGTRGQSTGPHLHFEVRLGGLNGEPVDPWHTSVSEEWTSEISPWPGWRWSQSVTPRSASQSIGSTRRPSRPPAQTSKCRCGPVENPREPTRAMSSPLSTV